MKFWCTMCCVCVDQLMVSQGDLKTILLVLNENLQEPGPSPVSVPTPPSSSPAKTPVTPTGQSAQLVSVYSFK